jgi:DNA-3-methyladenine glycosylase
MNRLSREFYERDTTQVAQELLGCLLVHQLPGGIRIGRIVETEAYLGRHDLAAHSSKGITPRTRIMYGAPGRAYVYLIYGIHHCMNVVTEPEGHGSAVLIRALEPVQGITTSTKGPGLLCKAMDINLRQNNQDLCEGDFFIAPPIEPTAVRIIHRPRIGVAYAGEWAHKPLRFYIEGNPYVSKP